MTRHHHATELRFNMDDAHMLRLPDIDSSTSYLTATLTIATEAGALCEWVEQDVVSAIDDLRNKTNLGLGPDGYLDVLFHGSEEVQLLIWNDRRAAPIRVVHTTEEAYYAAIDLLAETVDLLAATWPPLAQDH